MNKNRRLADNARKFSLHKETLRRLSQGDLTKAAGGTGCTATDSCHDTIGYTSCRCGTGNSAGDPCEIVPLCA